MARFREMDTHQYRESESPHSIEPPDPDTPLKWIKRTYKEAMDSTRTMMRDAIRNYVKTYPSRSRSG